MEEIGDCVALDIPDALGNGKRAGEAQGGVEQLIDGEEPDEVAEEPPVSTYGIVQVVLSFGRYGVR